MREDGRAARAAACARRGKDEPQPAGDPVESPVRSRGALPHPLGHRLGRVPRPPHRDLRGRRGQPDHARDDDGRHRARGALHRARSTPPWPARVWSRASTWWTRPTSTPSCWSRAARGSGSTCSARRGRTRAWQGKVEGGYTLDRFEIDWDAERVRCPQGKSSAAWGRRVDQAGAAYVSVWFREADCAACPARSLCTRTGQARHLRLQPRAEHEALDGRAGAARDEGGPARLRAAGRDRGHDLARGARLRPAPQPLPRAGQDPPAARGDRGRDRPPAPRRLVPGGPARRHPHLPLRRPRDGLSRLRQRYPAVWLIPLAPAVLQVVPEHVGGGRDGRAAAIVAGVRGAVP